MTEEEGKEEDEDIDWEQPFDDLRSSEINEISFEFANNGKKRRKVDDKDQPYTLFVFKVIRLDVKNPREIEYSTSSKELIKDLMELEPLKGKKYHISKTGSGFQTKYKLKKL